MISRLSLQTFQHNVNVQRLIIKVILNKYHKQEHWFLVCLCKHFKVMRSFNAWLWRWYWIRIGTQRFMTRVNVFLESKFFVVVPGMSSAWLLLLDLFILFLVFLVFLWWWLSFCVSHVGRAVQGIHKTLSAERWTFFLGLLDADSC